MNDREDDVSIPAGPGGAPAIKPADGANAKRPYQKPQVIYRAPLEAMASVCSPAPPAKSNPGLCPTGPISS